MVLQTSINYFKYLMKQGPREVGKEVGQRVREYICMYLQVEKVFSHSVCAQAAKKPF